MKVTEGIIDHGQIRLTTDVDLPDQTRVFVVVPDDLSMQPARIQSPRLADPRKMSFFKKEIVEDLFDGDV